MLLLTAGCNEVDDDALIPEGVDVTTVPESEFDCGCNIEANEGTLAPTKGVDVTPPGPTRGVETPLLSPP